VDVLLLLAQVVLAVLLVVMPLFSAYDKWAAWSPRRRIIAVAFAIGIAVVAFGQYQRNVKLHEGGLEHAIGNVGLLRSGPWYARRVWLTLWEYLGTVVAGSLLLSFALEAARKKAWLRFAASAGVFVLMLTLAVLLKLHTWSAD
jgi:hypothetical protein